MSWLHNLQSQITDLATGVLNEVTEEVEDPESELQVFKHKYEECEVKLSTETAKRSALEIKVKELEDSLYSTHVEMDSIGTKYGTMIATRDDEIKRLKVEIEQLRVGDDDDESHYQVIADLKKEIAHWKSLVKKPNEANEKSLKLQLEDFQRQKEIEIAALLENQRQILDDLRESYEERLNQVQGVASSSTSNADLLDAVLLEKEELIEAKKRLEDLVNRTNSEESPMLVDIHGNAVESTSSRSSNVENDAHAAELQKQCDMLQAKIDELSRENENYRDQVEKLTTDNDSLKCQNEELAKAYTDLDEEFARFKTENAIGRARQRNSELSIRVDSLKANLIEYEERYEMCRREHLETIRQLEKLNTDFERLRSGFLTVKQREAENDSSITEEVAKLRKSLEESRQERCKLKDDVDRFRTAVQNIDDELESLRSSHEVLARENSKLCSTIEKYENALKEVSGGETEFTKFRQELDELHKLENISLKNLIVELRAEVVALQNKNSILEEQIVILKDVQDMTKKAQVGENERIVLMTEKIKLLEAVREELLEKIKRSDEAPPKEAEASSINKDNVESVTLLLKEALAAVSEKTAECEELQKSFGELQSEMTLRQNCVDDLIHQNNVIQHQFLQSSESNSVLRHQLNQKEVDFCRVTEENVRLTRECEDLQTKLSTATDHMETLQLQSTSLNEQLERLQREKEEEVAINQDISEKLESAKNEIEQLRLQDEASVTNITVAEDVNNLTVRLEQAENLNEQLKKAITEKHEESLNYYNNLQSSVERIAILEKSVEETSSSQNHLQREIERLKEVHEKDVRELARLTEHLVMIEESSTREAVESEKREMELRSTIKNLQSLTNVTQESATESSQQYQSLVTSLQEQLSQTEDSLEKFKRELDSERKARAQTQEALASLQGVVRELSNDHEKELASTIQKHIVLESHCNAMTSKVSELEAEIERIGLDKQAAEEITETLRSSVDARQRIIEDLEGQLEELRSPKQTTKDSYRIDDSTLRQLFMNYFTATADMKPDIAVLLASILEYPPEDVQKIKQYVKPGHSAERIPSNSLSLTEQFVRFLESESESVKTAPHLPVSHESAKLKNDQLVQNKQQSSALADILK